MDKRIIFPVIAVTILLSYLLAFAWQGANRLNELVAEAQYVGVINNFPSRFHEPMDFNEREHLIFSLNDLKEGPGAAQGLDVSHSFAKLLEGQHFDLETVAELLRSNQLREAQSKLVELSVRVSEAHNRNLSEFIILFICGLTGCFLLAITSANLLSKKENGVDIEIGSNDPIDDTPTSPLAVAIRNVSDIESVKSGHDYVLELKGDEALSVTDPMYPLIEASICEMVANAIRHGGRASAVRVAAEKPGTIKVFVGIESVDSAWQITVADDGEGIDEMQTMQHALAKQLVTQDTVKGLEPGHGVKLILLEGFSDVKLNKGGILKSNSLASIREAVQAQGGTVALRNRPSVFCEFKLLIPSKS